MLGADELALEEPSGDGADGSGGSLSPSAGGATSTSSSTSASTPTSSTSDAASTTSTTSGGGAGGATSSQSSGGGVGGATSQSSGGGEGGATSQSSGGGEGGAGGALELTSTAMFDVLDNYPSGVCRTLPSDVIGTVATIDTVTIAMDHTWPGDLIFYLVAPSGAFSTILQRPLNGLGSTSANLSSAFPITFSEGAAVSADLLGSGLASGQVICNSDGICSFSPAPEGFSLLEGEAANGSWQFCASDNRDGDAGTITRIEVRGTVK
jgi:hypothetical protein